MLIQSLTSFFCDFLSLTRILEYKFVTFIMCNTQNTRSKRTNTRHVDARWIRSYNVAVFVIDEIRTIGSVLGQGIALDYYVRQVDEMVGEFTDIKSGMEKTGTFRIMWKKLFQLVGKTNSNLYVILKLGLFNQPDLTPTRSDQNPFRPKPKQPFFLIDPF
ncbi:hypothetical protein HanPI659440_Chr13g0514741 [Helianthus annuus]|nr:hypothetical protein HanPI659440_Chr13g0514741 [Helianthus annuus]